MTNLSHDALKDLTALAELESEGVFFDRRFLQLKPHAINNHGRVDDSCFAEPTALDNLVVRRAVLVRLGRFVGLITRKRQERTT